MVDQNTFTETIREVAEIIRTSAEPMSREEILGYFKDMELNTEQENMVLEFLLTPHEEPEEEETEESKVDEAAEKEEEEAEAEDAQTGKNDEPEDILPDSPMFQMYLEELKMQDQVEWVRRMNNIKNIAEESVMKIIYS